MKTLKLFVLAAVLAASPACKKDKKPEAKPADPGSASMAGSGSAAPTPTPDPGSAAAPTPTPDPGSAAAATPTTPAADETADWIKVYANHFTKNEADPVEVKFEKFKVVKADFDPKKIEGGSATLEIDIASLKTSDPKRDEHLLTPDYIDAKQFPAATVEINNVKKKDDKNYTADATVKFRKVEKKFPITFEVVEAKDDWIRVRGEHTFKRLDFKVGKKAGPDPKKGDDGVADDLTVKLQLTLKKT